MHVDLRVNGERGDVPAGVDLSAFRIIQEALTNVVKHAATPGCRVTIDYRDGELGLEVIDEGRTAVLAPARPGASPVVSGHGLIGMRERVHLCGGQFSAAAARPGVPGGRHPPAEPGRVVTLRVVVADDQALVRVGFRGIIDATPGFTVVGEAGNGREAIEVTRRAQPDVVLMDVRMPVMDGIEATRQITAHRKPATSAP